MENDVFRQVRLELDQTHILTFMPLTRSARSSGAAERRPDVGQVRSSENRTICVVIGSNLIFLSKKSRVEVASCGLLAPSLSHDSEYTSKSRTKPRRYRSHPWEAMATGICSTLAEKPQ